MTFHIEKKLRVTYSAPVHDCIRRLRVLPSKTLQENWQTWPEPDETREFPDDFGNRVMEMRHAKIESELLFELTCKAEPLLPKGHPPLVRGLGGSALVLPATGLGAFLLPSALCDLSETIRKNAMRFEKEDSELAMQICQWTHHALRYDAAVSRVETTASQSLARGAGVCQDYAHLMIALCRTLALPSRYVSGYLIGEGRMHAWVEVLIENQWHAYDPTHNRKVESECLAVAIGRDFRDCNPHQGTFRGHAKAQLESGCRVYHVSDSS